MISYNNYPLQIRQLWFIPVEGKMISIFNLNWVFLMGKVDLTALGFYFIDYWITWEHAIDDHLNFG